jgi:hypothetical protein
MAKRKKVGQRVVKMSPLTIARIDDRGARLGGRVEDHGSRHDPGEASGPQEVAAPFNGTHLMIAASYARKSTDQNVAVGDYQGVQLSGRSLLSI